MIFHSTLISRRSCSTGNANARIRWKAGSFQARSPAAATNIPGVLTAGTFYQDGKRVFWNIHNPENTVVIELKDERYNELIVEVADQKATVELIKSALPR